MAITYGFFDAVNSDRVYNAEQMTHYFDGIVSDGVFENIGNRFVVASAHDGMKITVGSGRALIRSHWVVNDAATEFTLDPADAGANRTDAVALRLDMDARTISLIVKKGTASNGEPTPPAIVREGSVWELYLAYVRVNKGATQPSFITDLRPSQYCGWVTGVIEQVDTSDLFTQWEAAYSAYYAQMTAEFDAYIAQKTAAFNAWFATLTQELEVDTSITKYQSTWIAPREQYAGTLFEVGIPEYDETTDILFVYVNGLFAYDGTSIAENVDGHPAWFFVNEGEGFVSLNKNLQQGDEIAFVVIKNQPGGGGITAPFPIGESVLRGVGSVGGMAGKILTPNLPYIQSSGAQGIRCDFTPSSTDVKYELKYADNVPPDSNTWQQLFGGYVSNMRPGGIGSSRSVYGNNLVCCIGNGERLTGIGFTKGGYHELTVQISGNDVDVTFDGMTFSDTWAGSIACPVGLCCGATASGIQDYSAVKVYGFKIYEGGTLKRDFSPALGDNDRPGFYDAVSETMFYSVTGTDFEYVPAETEE